ncbi:hypothetical protein Tco_1516275 [Tanacetum coccineum]
MAPDVTCPSTSQLLRSISLVLVRASLAAISKLLSSSGCSGKDYTSSCPPPSLVRLLAAASSFFESRLRIPLDLHPRLPDPGFTMDRLPADDIGIYYEFLWDWFSFSKRRNTEDVCMDDGPSSLKKWKNKFFLIDRRVIPDHLTWRHSCSCVSDDLPFDGYDRNDVQRLFLFGNQECDPIFRRVDDNVEMSIYDFMTLPSWSDAKIAEESHHLSLPLLERAPTHTTAPATEGAIILLPTPDEIAASLPYSRLVKKSKGPSHANRPSKKRKLHKRDLEAGSSAPELDQAKGTDETGLADLYAEIEDSLERDEGVSTRAVSAPTLRLSKRLGAPPSIAVVSASKPSHVGTSAPASTSGRSLSLGDICRKALDRTITPSELRRTESLLPLELSNRVNVLSALLVSHGYELNSCYANLVSSKAHLQEKFDQNKGDVKLLRSERDAGSEEIRKLRSQLTDAKTSSDVAGGLREEVTQFVGFGVESLVRKLLSSDEFHVALARVASLGINYGVEKGLRMGRTDVEFEAAVQKVSNFHVGAKADFDKALDDFPTTPFPFLSKIVAASEGSLADVAQILLDKFVRSATSVAVAPSSANEAPKRVPP